MISFHHIYAHLRASLTSLFAQLLLQRHRARAGISVAALALTLVFSLGGDAQAGSVRILPVPRSILPVDVGIGIPSSQAVTLAFPEAMDQTSVEEALEIRPAQAIELNWDGESRSLWVAPQGLWSTDQRYLLTLAASTLKADGQPLGQDARFSFTTQTAPRVVDFRVHFVAEAVDGHWARALAELEPPAPLIDTASSVSAATSIELAFNAPINRDEAVRAFNLSPAVTGILAWQGQSLIFSPVERLVSGARYAVSLVGVHDSLGNPLDGDTSFSFTVRPGAQLVRTTPAAGATGVHDIQIALWFSEPMNQDSVTLMVLDRGVAVTGQATWSAAHTQLQFDPDHALAAGHTFTVSLGPKALDADGNPLAVDWSFTTKPAAVRRVSPPQVAASSTLTGYALNQINAARSAYGLYPLWLDDAISAMALTHAWDQMQHNYFRHAGRDGSTPQTRLRAAGIAFNWASENLCMDARGWGTIDVLNWCYGLFMSEPYPGYPNHIGNILNTHYTRVGIGIAVSGGRTIVVWDFAD